MEAAVGAGEPLEKHFPGLAPYRNYYAYFFRTGDGRLDLELLDVYPERLHTPFPMMVLPGDHTRRCLFASPIVTDGQGNIRGNLLNY